MLTEIVKQCWRRRRRTLLEFWCGLVMFVFERNLMWLKFKGSLHGDKFINYPSVFCRVNVKRNVGRRLLWWGRDFTLTPIQRPCHAESSYGQTMSVDCLSIWTECKLNFIMLEGGLMSINTVPISTFSKSLLLSLIKSAFCFRIWFLWCYPDSRGLEKTVQVIKEGNNW